MVLVAAWLRKQPPATLPLAPWSHGQDLGSRPAAGTATTIQQAAELDYVADLATAGVQNISVQKNHHAAALGCNEYI